MVRTQIQLTDEQYKKLKKKADLEGVSMSELIRKGVDRVLESPANTSYEEIRSQSLEIMGKFQSGRKDVSAKHDDYLGEAYK